MDILPRTDQLRADNNVSSIVELVILNYLRQIGVPANDLLNIMTKVSFATPNTFNSVIDEG